MVPKGDEQFAGQRGIDERNREEQKREGCAAVEKWRHGVPGARERGPHRLIQ